MKIFVFSILSTYFLLIDYSINAQTVNNLNKYWYYRERLKKEFVYVSPNNEQGSNIPASFASSSLNWDDGNSAISHYLGVLATEYRLLKNNEKDCSQTLRELKYALSAVDRIDQTAEYHYGSTNNLNGFFLRDDIDDSFWNKYKKGGTTEHFSKEYYNSCSKNSKLEMSQDNVWHLLEGLALIKALVNKELVDGVEVDFPKWTQEITYRVIKVMQHSDAYTVDLIDKWYLHVRFDIYWYLKNPVTNNFVPLGSGIDLDNQLIWSCGFAEAGNWILDVGKSNYPSLHYSLSNTLARSIFTEMLNDDDGSYDLYYMGIKVMSFYKDFYNVNSLATIAGNIIDDTYDKLITKKNNPENYGPYDHFPLIYLLLHEKTNFELNKYGSSLFNSEKNYYQTLLNKAPLCGPYKYGSGNYGSFEWSSTSRLVWPENLGDNDVTLLGDYSGLDYMLLHNLYYLVYEDDFRAVADLYEPITNQGSTSSPVIYNANKIISKSKIDNSSVKYLANEKIVLKTGFETSSGSNFYASINQSNSSYASFSYDKLAPSTCSLSLKSLPKSQNTNTTNEDKTKKISKYSSKDEGSRTINNEVEIYPNPNKGRFSIKFFGEIPAKIEVYNSSGVMMYNSIPTFDKILIELPSGAIGINYIKVIYSDFVESKKIIVLH